MAGKETKLEKTLIKNSSGKDVEVRLHEKVNLINENTRQRTTGQRPVACS
jgi:hypothetical protein